MSLRASALFPSTCSGDMYGNVPTSWPSAVMVSGVAPEATSSPSLQLGQAEIQQLHPGGGEHDVAGLEVAVDDPGAVGRRQRARDLDRGLESVIQAYACRSRRQARDSPSRYSITM